jgi:H/ACA ribonucleoprotein complex subunit 4
VKRALRVRNIYSLDVLDICGPLVLMRIRCEAGTYIRKLCHDIGLVLGCGAHMQQLRRTGTGPFGEDTLVTLHDLKDAFVLWKEEGREEELRRVVKPMEEALRHLPSITVRDSAVNAICHGAALAIPGVAGVDENLEQDAIAVMYSLKGEAVALCRSRMSAGEILESEHGICGITERVIMDADIYPTGWKTKSPCSG